ncbi:MAG TPA: nickel-dependent hydrogenase large subunit [Candidatus Methanoperedenaceae archaeon]|nr:nickel-dependent hydrogenase large subunit [Candidatus Methanoperedenaceae archaeon]
MTTITIDPLTRIEGHLRITAEVDERGIVKSARSSGTLFRGIERIAQGRDPRDMARIASRICGVCPTCHSIASVSAQDDLFGVASSVPRDALVMRNILQGLNWVASHATHIYVLFAPDLANPGYRKVLESRNLGSVWKELAGRFAPISYAIEGQPVPPGSSYLAAIPARRKLHEAMAVLGGKMPDQMAAIVGGVTYRPTAADITKVASYWIDTAGFVNDYVLPGSKGVDLDTWLSLTHDGVSPEKAVENLLGYMGGLSLNDLSREAGWSDAVLFAAFGSELVGEKLLSLPASLKLDRLGGYGDASKIGFLSYGVFYNAEKDGFDPTSPAGERFLSSGFTSGDLKREAFDHMKVTEHVAHSFYTSGSDLHPWDGATEPVKAGSDIGFEGDKYSWLKAARYRGIPSEVGPLARMINNKEPLVMGLAAAFAKNGYSPANVYTRMLARMQETLIVARELKKWVTEDLDPAGRYAVPTDLWMAKSGKGVGLWEGPRGALGHWLSTGGDSMIRNYQAVVPTTWNAGPRDGSSVPGPIEQALSGSAISAAGNALGADNANPVGILHVARSYDPCLACAVHTIDMNATQRSFLVVGGL